MKTELIKINVPGGILSPGELRRIVSVANYCDIDSVFIGSRQNIILKVNEKYVGEYKKRIQGLQYKLQTGDTPEQNVMTSFVSMGLYNSVSWLTEGIYLEILSSFSYNPRLKINIVDPNQPLLPLFSGDLNFIASYHENYWYLYLKVPGKEKLELWPVLIDGEEISIISESLESVFLKQPRINLIQLEVYIYNLRNWNFRMIDRALSIRPVRFSNFEGFHSMGERYCLGIYQRENGLPIHFIENLCLLCSQTNIGNIGITPWNSIIIKNIEEKYIPLWERLLGKYGINTGHSIFELNWKLPEMNKRAVKLKNYILYHLQKKGLRTDGLTFGISSGTEEPFASVIISKKSLFRLLGKFSFFSSYEVKYKKDFDPNSFESVHFADGLKRRNIPQILSYISGMYYEKLNNNPFSEIVLNESQLPDEENKGKKVVEVFQCSECLTIYDPLYGDETFGIPPGTSFDGLPSDYRCSLCESHKESFRVVNMEELIVR